MDNVIFGDRVMSTATSASAQSEQGIRPDLQNSKEIEDYNAATWMDEAIDFKLQPCEDFDAIDEDIDLESEELQADLQVETHKPMGTALPQNSEARNAPTAPKMDWNFDWDQFM
jgi:hypothetical protein